MLVYWIGGICMPIPVPFVCMFTDRESPDQKQMCMRAKQESEVETEIEFNRDNVLPSL